MGLEGAVKAGFKKELEAVKDANEREALYEQLVAQLYERGTAINMAAYLEIDVLIFKFPFLRKSMLCYYVTRK